MEYLICPNCNKNSWKLEWCTEYPLPIICTCTDCGWVVTTYGDGE